MKKKESVRRPAHGRRKKRYKSNKKLIKRVGGLDDYPDAPANMTAKKYNKKHRVLKSDKKDKKTKRC